MEAFRREPGEVRRVCSEVDGGKSDAVEKNEGPGGAGAGGFHGKKRLGAVRSDFQN